MILFLYFGSYTCITKHVLVLRILYLCYITYSYISGLILVLQNLFLSYGSYTCVTELILVFQILFLCEGTRRYDNRNRSESYHIQGQIRLMQIRTLVRSRYRSHQIHIPGSYRFRTYPKTNRVVGLYHKHL